MTIGGEGTLKDCLNYFLWRFGVRIWEVFRGSNQPSLESCYNRNPWSFLWRFGTFWRQTWDKCEWAGRRQQSGAWADEHRDWAAWMIRCVATDSWLWWEVLGEDEQCWLGWRGGLILFSTCKLCLAILEGLIPQTTLGWIQEVQAGSCT